MAGSYLGGGLPPTKARLSRGTRQAVCRGSCGHTHRVGASQDRRSPLWLTPVLQGRSGCAAQGHPVCGEHSWAAWKSPAQAATFSLHSRRPQGPAGPAQVKRLTALSKGYPPTPTQPCLHHRLTPDLIAAELSTAWEEILSSILPRVTDTLLGEGDGR